MRARTLILILGILLFTAPAFGATQWAVVIGVSQYRYLPESQNLKYADQDARLFNDFLLGVGVPPDNIRFLRNEQATQENVKGAIGSWLADRSGPDDMVYVYFAGHGVVSKGEAYFAPYDYKADNPDGTGLEMSDLKKYIQRLKFQHIVVITDACHSGNVGKDNATGRDLEEVEVNKYITGIATENAGVAKSQFILTASGSNERSFEHEKWGGGHGVFTYFLVDGLKGKADTDRDGFVSANEIFNYVHDQVRRDTDNKQNPLIASTDFDGNLRLSSPSGGALVSSSAVVTRTAPPRVDSPAGAPDTPVQPGRLTISSNITAARLLIDDVSYPSVDPGSPKTLTLAAGSHEVNATRDGYKTYKKTVEIRSGSEQQLSVMLEAEFSSTALELRAQFSGALNDLAVAAQGPATANNAKLAREAVLKIESVFNSLLTTGTTRALLADEQDLTDEVLMALGAEYLKQNRVPDLATASQKYVSIFSIIRPSFIASLSNEFRNEFVKSVGIYTYTVTPAGSVVEVDSTNFGPVDRPKQVWLSPGPHVFKASREGYLPDEARTQIVPGESTLPPVRLKLATINVFMFSETSGAQVIRDKNPAATFVTVSAIRSKLQPEQVVRLNAELDRRKLDPQVQVAMLPSLPPDTSQLDLQFSRDKYSTQIAKVDLSASAETIYNARGDYFWNGLVKLDKLMGKLQVRSTPTGADVIVDNKTIGKTPLETTLEIGDFDVVVRWQDVWRSSGRVTIRNNEAAVMDARLKAPITFLGIHSPVVDASRIREVEKPISEALQKVVTRHLPDPQNPDRYEYTRDFIAAIFSEKADKANAITNHLKQMKERFRSELFLFGIFPTESDYLAGNLKFYLFSSFAPRADVRDVSILESGQIEAVLKEIDSVSLSAADLLRPYSGLTTIDTELTGHEVVVLKVDEDSPVGRAGVKKGDSVLTINGESATSSKIRDWVAGHPVGSNITLGIESTEGRKTVSFKSDPLPKVLTQSGAHSFDNMLISELTAMRLAASPADSDQTNMIVFNEALAYIAKEDWTDAIVALNRFKNDAPQAASLRPAIDYYQGFSYEKRNDPARARDWYSKAVAEKSMLLQSELGFNFQTLSTWRLDYLK